MSKVDELREQYRALTKQQPTNASNKSVDALKAQYRNLTQPKQPTQPVSNHAAVSQQAHQNVAKKQATLNEPVIGKYGAGNIDLTTRPIVQNKDGSISTVRSMSFNADGKEILVPTVVNGKVVSNEEAIKHYYDTGEYLGKFDTIDEANNYAEALHRQQEKLYQAPQMIGNFNASNFREAARAKGISDEEIDYAIGRMEAAQTPRLQTKLAPDTVPNYQAINEAQLEKEKKYNPVTLYDKDYGKKEAKEEIKSGNTGEYIDIKNNLKEAQANDDTRNIAKNETLLADFTEKYKKEHQGKESPANLVQVQKSLQDLQNDKNELEVRFLNATTPEEKQKIIGEYRRVDDLYKNKYKAYSDALAYDEIINNNIAKDTASSFGLNVLGGTANTINAGYAYGSKLTGNDATTINADSLLQYNNGSGFNLLDAANIATKLNPITAATTNATGLLEGPQSAYTHLGLLASQHQDNPRLMNLYREITNHTYKGTKEDLQNELNAIQQELYQGFKDKYTQDELDAVANQMRHNEIYGGASVIPNAFGTVGNMVPSMLMGYATGGIGELAGGGAMAAAGTGANIAQQVGSYGTLGLGAAGSAIDQALQQGGTYNQALEYGALKGATEVGTEMIGGETVNRLFGQYGKTALGKVFGRAIDDLNIESKVGRFIANQVSGVASEMTEEMISEAVDPLWQVITYNPNALPKNLNEVGQYIKNVIKAGVDAIPSTLLMQGSGMVVRANNIQTIENGIIKSINEDTELSQIVKNQLINEVRKASTDVKLGLEEADYMTDKMWEKNANLAAQSEQMKQRIPQGYSLPQSTIDILAYTENNRPGLNINFDTNIQGNGTFVENADGSRTITLNPNSQRAVEFTLTHELGHDLKGTQEYTQLQNILEDYAKGKPKYSESLRALEQTYQKSGANFNLKDEATNDMLGQAIGEQEFYNKLAENPTLFNRVTNGLKNLLGNKETKLKNKIEKLTSNALKQEYRGKQEGTQQSLSEKSKQLEIIQKSNPMTDDYHTGIRNIDDIKTYQEAVEDEGVDGDLTPDYTADMVQKALDTGKVTVYSSYPIENGTFVTPSKMEAQSYAGNNQVYSKEVNLDDVAWIDNLQGQYAKTDTQYSLSEAPTRDNQGRELSKEQQERFKDSKVRDNNGNLERVYHTSNTAGEQFNEFNPVGTPHYRFGDTVVNYYTNSKKMSGSYANGKYEMANTSKSQKSNRERAYEQAIEQAKKDYYSEGYEFEPGQESDIFGLPYDTLNIYFNENGNKKLKETRKVDTGGKKYQYEGYIDIENPYIVEGKGNSWDSVEEQLTPAGERLTAEYNILKDNDLLYTIKRTYDKADYEASEKWKEFQEWLYNLDWFQQRIVWEYAREGNLDNLYQHNFTLDAIDKKNMEKHINDVVNGKTLKEIGLLAYEGKRDKIFEREMKKIKEEHPDIDFIGTNDLTNLASMYQGGLEQIKHDYSKGISTNDIVKKVIELNKNGSDYDGIIFKDIVDYGGQTNTYEPANVYVTFSSNQFKNIDNTTPTDNPDIRYSKSNASWQDFLDQNLNLAQGTKTNFERLPTNEELQEQETSKMARDVQALNLDNPGNVTLLDSEDDTLFSLSEEQVKEVNNYIRKLDKDNAIPEDVKRDFLDKFSKVDNYKDYQDLVKQVKNYKNTTYMQMEDTKETRQQRVAEFIKDTKSAEGTIGQKIKSKDIKQAIDKNIGIERGNGKKIQNVIKSMNEDMMSGSLTDTKIDKYVEQLGDTLKSTISDYYEAYKGLKQQLKNTKIYISDDVKRGITDYNDFRKANMGTLKLTNDSSARSIDQVYKELQEQYPEMLPDDIINPADQLEHLAEMSSQIVPEVGNIRDIMEKQYGNEAWEEAATNLKNELKNLRDNQRAEPKEVEEKEPKEKFTKWTTTAQNNSLIREFIEKKEQAYIPETNKKQLAQANKQLEQMGYEDAKKFIDNKVRYNERITATDMALVQRLVQEGIKRGEFEQAQELIADAAIMGKDYGQVIQAMSMINRMTPEGQLMYLNKVIDRMNDKIDKKNEKRGENNQIANIELDKELATDILKATDDVELQQAMDAALQRIADQMEVSLSEKISEWRYLAMLANPRTHIRNIVANVGMKGVYKTKNQTQRAIETIAAPLLNERTRTFEKSSKDVKNFAETSTNEIKDLLGGNEQTIENRLKEMRKIFKNETLEKLRRFNSNMLSLEDNVFTQQAYKENLAEYLTANGIKTQNDIDMNPELVQKGIQYAKEEAWKTTFHQMSKFATELNRIENINGFSKLLVGGMIPFKKTPINIAKTGASYSPLGLLETLTAETYNLKTGKISANEYIDRLSQGLTGSAIFALGAFLSKLGMLKAGTDDDDEYAEDIGQTKKYSIRIGDRNYDISWFAPSAMPLLMGAELVDATKGKEMSFGDIAETLSSAINPLSEMSFVSGLNSTIKSYSNSDSPVDAIGAAAKNTIKSYFGQFLPTIGGQINKIIDDTERSTTASRNSKWREGESFARQQLAKIPGASFLLEPKTDVWGNDKKRADSVVTRAFDALINPGTVTKDMTTDVDREIMSLIDATDDNSLKPSVPKNYFNYNGEKKELSAKDYTKLKKTQGQYMYNTYDALMDNEFYKQLDDEKKATIIKQIAEDSKDVAKASVGYETKNFNTLDVAKEELDKYDIPLVDYYFYKAELKGLSGKNAKKTAIAHITDSLNEKFGKDYINKKDKEALWDIFGVN